MALVVTAAATAVVTAVAMAAVTAAAAEPAYSIADGTGGASAPPVFLRWEKNFVLF